MNKTSIKTLINIALGLLALLIIVQGIFAFVKADQLEQQVKEIVNVDTQINNQVFELRLHVVQVQQWLTDISVTRGQNGLNDGFSKAQLEATHFRNIIATLKKLDAQYSQDYDSLLQAFEQYYAEGQRMANAYVNTGTEAGNSLMPSFDKQAENLDLRLKPIIQRVGNQIAEHDAHAILDAKFARVLTIVTLCALLGALFFIALASAKYVVLPLQRLVNLTKELAQGDGDLTKRLDENNVGELANLSIYMNRFITKVQTNVQALHGEIRSINRATSDLNDSISNTVGVMGRQQSETDQVAVAIEQMSASVQEVARNAAVAASSAQSANTASRDGREVVMHTLSAIQQLADEVVAATGVIKKLEGYSSDIAKVSEVIGEIAEQTNLLALNAAIEAARAGEQGRGFAVVADEVRNLSQRTGKLTQEIKTIIDKLIIAARNANQAMITSSEQVKALASRTDTADQALNDITSQVSVINDMNNQIAFAAEQQRSVSSELSSNVSNISHVSNQTLHEMNNIMHTSHDLAVVIEKLTGVVNKFKF